MAVSEKGWVGWVLANKAAAGGIAASLALVTSGIVVVAVRSGDDSSSATGPSGRFKTTETTLAPGETTTSLTDASQSSVTGPRSTTKGTTRSGLKITAPPPPGFTVDTKCTATPGYKQTGLDDKTVHIGQIVSDVNILPAQLEPNHQGLLAAIGAINAAGGVCGRKLELDYRNDFAVPNNYKNQYQELMATDFAFVAISSLQDSGSYQSDAPFDPLYKDGDEFVPDIGGLAYAYGRNQSQWFAGALGSLSPSLAGGLAFRRITQEAASGGGSGKGKCKGAGVVYLDEPTGASQDSAEVGKVALANKDWGAGLDNVHGYDAPLAAPRPVYENMVRTMKADGVNCVFTYADLGSNVTLVQAMEAQSVWPPDRSDCDVVSGCFSVMYMPFSGYDPSFITQAGDAAKFVTTFTPHVPLNETSAPALKAYLDAMKAYQPGKSASTFSIVGYASGLMFANVLQACGGSPTRKCVMEKARALKDFTAGGLLGGTTPFKSTRVNCADGCGSFGGHGTYDFKWIFTCTVGLRVADKGGKRDFYRTYPASGYECDTLHVARGKPA